MNLMKPMPVVVRQQHQSDSKNYFFSLKQLGLLLCLIHFSILNIQAQGQFDFQTFNANDGGFNCTFHEVTTGAPDCGTNDLGLTANISQSGPVTSSTRYVWMQDVAGNQNPTCFGKAHDLSSLGLTEGDKIRVQFQYAANYGTGDADVGFFVKGWTDAGGDGIDLVQTFASNKLNASGLTFTAVDFPINSVNFPDLSKVIVSFCLNSDGASATNTNAYGVMDFYTLLYFKKPQATFTVVEDCNNNQFTIAVNLTDIGSSSNGVDLTDGTTTLANRPVGMYSFGPYPSGTNVTIQANAVNYGGLNISSETLTGCFTEIPMNTTGTQTRNLCAGTFVDSGTSTGDYGNNESGVLTICPTSANSLARVAFSAFSIEANDALQIYNGNSISAPSLGSFTGTNSPGTVTASNGTGCLTFRFTSNASISGTGWVSEISCVPATCSVNITNITQTNCTNGMYDAQVTVSYSFLTAGNQIILSEAGGASQTVTTANSFGTEVITLTGLTADGAADMFTVRDGSNAGCTFTTSFTSSCVCDVTINSITQANCNGSTYSAAISVTYAYLRSGNQIKITETNSGAMMTFNASAASGTQTFTFTGLTADAALENFVAQDASLSTCMDSNNTFSAPPNGCAPTVILMGSVASVTTCSSVFYDSGGLENQYQANESSTLTICPSSAGSQIRAAFLSNFSVDEQYDGLMIYDGNSTSSPFIPSGNPSSPGFSACSDLVAGAFWGTNSPGTITSTHSSGCLTFKFCSEDILEENGWQANISCVPATCNISVSSVAAVNCSSGTYGAQVVVNYAFLNAGNQIKITEQNSGTTMTFAANGATGTQTFVLPGLTADGAAENFKVEDANASSCTTTYTTFSAPPANCTVPNTNIVMGQVASPQVICAGNFYDPGGSSGNYAAYESETLTICPSQVGAKTKVTFTSFSTENRYDGLMIYNGNNTSAPLISSNQSPDGFACSDLAFGGYFGTNSPGTVTSNHSSGCLTFVFCSDVNTEASGWAATISCEGGALALDLVNFAGIAEDKVNRLQWTTINEQNTESHSIERSSNGLHDWETVGKVAAAGTTTETTTYEILDHNPLKVAYYRIHTLHTDGTSLFSEIIVVERIEQNIGIINVAPNPTKDQVWVRVFSKNDNEQVQARLTNVMGQVIYTESWGLDKGENNRSLNFESFANGIYLLQMDNGKSQEVRRIVKH